MVFCVEGTHMVELDVTEMRPVPSIQDCPCDRCSGRAATHLIRDAVPLAKQPGVRDDDSGGGRWMRAARFFVCDVCLERLLQMAEEW